MCQAAAAVAGTRRPHASVTEVTRAHEPVRLRIGLRGGRPTHTMSWETLTRAPPLHQRGTAAVILSRHASEVADATGRDNPGPPLPLTPDHQPVSRWRTLLTWALLGAAIAWLWTLLLVGDSLAA
jgi:hypothetical protein